MVTKNYAEYQTKNRILSIFLIKIQKVLKTSKIADICCLRIDKSSHLCSLKEMLAFPDCHKVY